MTDRKKVRINVYLDGKLKDLEHVFLKTYNKKSLAGTMLENLLLFILEKKGKDYTEKVVYEIVKGNVSILEEIFSSPGSASPEDVSVKREENIPDDRDTDSTIDISKFLI